MVVLMRRLSQVFTSVAMLGATALLAQGSASPPPAVRTEESVTINVDLGNGVAGCSEWAVEGQHRDAAAVHLCCT